MASPNEFYNGNLDLFKRAKLAAYFVFDLGLSPDIGHKHFPRAMMFMPQSVLKKAVSKHRIDLDVLVNLPHILCSPVAVFTSKTVPNSFVIQISSKWLGASLVVAIEHVHHADFGTSYMVKSIHPRPDDQIANWEAEGLLIYKK